jgi:uncharacterized protein YodC (DUF2158 family)
MNFGQWKAAGTSSRNMSEEVSTKMGTPCMTTSDTQRVEEVLAHWQPGQGACAAAKIDWR